MQIPPEQCVIAVGGLRGVALAGHAAGGTPRGTGPAAGFDAAGGDDLGADDDGGPGRTGGADGGDARGDDLTGSVHAVPDDRAVVVGEVGAFAAAEALGPVQGAFETAVALGGDDDPLAADGDRRLLEGGVGAGEGDRRFPAVRPEHLGGGLPVVGHEGQLAVHAVGDDESAVGGGGEARHGGGDDVEGGREVAGGLAQPHAAALVGGVVDGDDAEGGGDLGQQFGRHGGAGGAHAVLGGGGVGGGAGPALEAGGAAGAVTGDGDDVEGAPQASVGGAGEAGVQGVVGAAGDDVHGAEAFCTAAGADAASDGDGVTAVDVFGPGVGGSVGGGGDGRVPDVAVDTLADEHGLAPGGIVAGSVVGVQASGVDAEPARIAGLFVTVLVGVITVGVGAGQAALPDDLDDAVGVGDDLLVEGGAVAGADALRGRPALGSAVGCPDGDVVAVAAAEEHPRDAVGAERGGGPEDVGEIGEDRLGFARGAGAVESCDEPVALALDPLDPRDEGAGGGAGGDARPGGVAARHGDGGAAGVPGQRGGLLENALGEGDLGGDVTGSLVDPHVAQRIGVEAGDGGGGVEAGVDGVGEAVVEGEHEFEVGTLLGGVVAGVVVGGAAVRVAVMPVPV